MNYLVLVNKNNSIEDKFYTSLQLVQSKDVEDKPIMVEKETFTAYLKLKEYLEEKKIVIGLNSGFRDLEKQQQLIEEYTIKYGEEYVKKHVAAVGSSEHHTGLAIDLWVKLEGEYPTEKDKSLAREGLYQEIHKYLKYFGFILRYPKEKEEITGYNYEPWHIRYVGLEPALYISNNNLCLEEFLLINNKKESELAASNNGD